MESEKMREKAWDGTKQKKNAFESREKRTKNKRDFVIN